MSRLLTALALLASLFGPSIARAQSAAEMLSNARLEYEYKNFEKAIQLLERLLDESRDHLQENEDELTAVREMLGLSYFYLGKREKARQQFTKLLFLRPKHRLDPFLIPPPAVRFFDSIWKDEQMKKALEQISKRKARESAKGKEKENPKPPSVVRKVYLERNRTKHSRFLAFMPFGIGQFQNGDDGWGVAAAATQGAALFTNVACWSLLLVLEKDGGGYEDLRFARGLQIAQYSSLGLFVALWIGSAIEANLSFEKETVEPFKRVREEMEEAEEKGPASLRMMPTALPGGAALKLGFRF